MFWVSLLSNSENGESKTCSYYDMGDTRPEFPKVISQNIKCYEKKMMMLQDWEMLD